MHTPASTSSARSAVRAPRRPSRAVITPLRQKALPYVLEHADQLEQQLERHGPDRASASLHPTDDLLLRPFTWAGWQLRFPLPVED